MATDPDVRTLDDMVSKTQIYTFGAQRVTVTHELNGEKRTVTK